MSKKEIPDFTQNRELSWLRFNQRVLEEARDESVPLMERMKFVAIFTSNLDEFFMIRVGSLYDLAATDDKKIDQRSGMTAKQQLDAIYRAVSPLYKERDKTYAEIKKQLHPYGVCGLDFKELEQQEKKFVKKYFKEQRFSYGNAACFFINQDSFSPVNTCVNTCLFTFTHVNISVDVYFNV